MKVYIAGPMRGILDWNFPQFDIAERRWREAGHHPLSPAQTCRALGYALTNGEDPNEPVDSDHLKHVISTDIACIYASDAVAVLSGWETSLGATVEVALAQFLGLPIYCAVRMVEVYPQVTPWNSLKESIGIYNKRRN